MFSFIRKLWLVNRLSEITLKNDVVHRFIRETKFGQSIKMDKNSYILLEDFIEERAEKYWFGLACKKKEKKRCRKEKDYKLIVSCLDEKSKLVDIILGKNLSYISPDKHNEEYIRATEIGYEVSRPINSLVEFCNKYKIIWVIVIGIAGFSWWSKIKSLLSFLLEKIN
jgi:hypothetical protein